jgi:glyoxylase-like metal-dependent hydrolase (beta-lactamase superfamily II)
MNLFPIDTGLFKLDGGAMFGVVPKSIWNKTNPADNNNLCTFAMRSLLVEDGDRLILIDTGLGNKQSEKFFAHFHLHGEDTLKSSLKKHGFSPDDITDVLLTHLHFDHVGGGVQYNSDRSKLELVFKNAKYWNNKNHWDWATNPNPREKASFLKENILPIQESGHLHFIENGNELGDNISFLMVNGHTESQIIPHISYNGKTVVFMADLLPSVGHIPLPYVMAYDTRPLITMLEKDLFLNQAVDKDYILFLQHDAINECCNLKITEKGIRLDKTFNLNDF